MKDFDEFNFLRVVEINFELYNRNIFINWLFFFICYWWIYCNIVDCGIEFLFKFLYVFFFVLVECILWMVLFVVLFLLSLYMLKIILVFIRIVFKSLLFV